MTTRSLAFRRRGFTRRRHDDGRPHASGVTVKVHLRMSAHLEPDADSGDVVGELPGKEHPEEVVVIGGHIDSWDVGQGAQDDGASIIACLQAVALMKKLGLEPRRTIRVPSG